MLKRTLGLLLAAPLFIATAHATPVKMPAAVRADLRANLKQSPVYASATKPSFRGYITENGKTATATMTLMGMGHRGPIFSGATKPVRMGLWSASVKFNPKTGKEIGRIQSSGMMQPLGMSRPLNVK